jgi:NADP-dependent 3-hydroxy acid dehydrogenase YdfG
MKDLRGKVAFITGGSSGIGLGIAKVLADEGMKVVVTYRRQDHLEETLAYFRSRPGQQVHAIKLDVTDRKGFSAAADEAERVFGPVQVLVNNAGIGILGLMEHATFDDWDWIMGVNLGGVVNALVTFLPRMIALGQPCHIVNVSSIGGVAALGSAGLYATTKFAVVGLTEALRTDMIGRPIGVSVKSNIGEGERGRPAQFAESGYKTVAPVGAPPPEFLLNAMDAVDAGRHVLRGIRENQLYIFSHPEFRDVLAARGAALLQALPDEPINQARADSIRWLLSNRIYDEGA